MVEPLSVNTEGVRSLADIHVSVANSLASLASTAPGSAEVASSHGTTATGVSNALTAPLDSRAGSMIAARSSAEATTELLRQAAVAYERGDRRGAQSIAETVHGLGSAADEPTE